MNAEKAYKDWIESRLDRGLIMPFFPVEIFIAGFEEAKKKMDAYVMRDEKLATAMQIIEMQKEALSHYANRMDSGGTARNALTKTNELIKEIQS